jgi:nitrate/nitrite transport system substrate-binding protein
MKRWGYVKGEVDYQALAEKVFLMTDARKAMRQIGAPTPAAANAGGYKPITVMGHNFDSSRPGDYLNSFAIKRA